VMLGVRPSDLRIAASGIRARVERIEDLGDSTIVTFMMGDRALKLKSDRLQPVQEGEDVMLGFAAEAAHLFDPNGGGRL
jgi:ABC-type sugar transport system ATPase subunit